MNETTESTVSVFVAIMWFVLSVSIAMGSYILQERSLDAVVNAVEREDHRLQTTIKIEDDELYTGAQVIQTLFNINNIEADIQVNEIFFSKVTSIESTDISSIDPKKKYQVSFIRNSEGTIEKILFRG